MQDQDAQLPAAKLANGSSEPQLAAEGDSSRSSMWRTAPPITHADIVEWVAKGGYLRSVIIEAQGEKERRPWYAVYVLASWRPGYCIFHVHWPARPRLFRDLDRLMALIRFEFRYEGTVAVRLASEGGSGPKRAHFRAG